MLEISCHGSYVLLSAHLELFVLFGFILYIPVNNFSVMWGWVLGPIGQSAANLTADPGVASSILARPYTFMEIDHDIIVTVFLLLPLIQEELLSVTTGNRLVKLAHEKSVVRKMTVST